MHYLLKLIFIIFRAIGEKKSSWVGKKIFLKLGPLTKFHDIALKNITIVFPKITISEKNRILTKMWENIGSNFGEFIHIKSFDPFNDKRFKIKGKASLKKLIDKNKDNKKGIIFFSAHFGNWELGPLILSKLGLKPLCIYRKSNNKAVDLLVQNIRKDFAQYVPKGDSGAKKSYLWLRKGGSLAMLMDQKLNEGRKINFLGKPAFTATAIAELALRMELDVVPLKIKKENNMFKIDFLNELKLPNKNLPHKKKVDNVLEQVNSLMSSWILESPEQWLWIHRRWEKENYIDF